MLKVKLVKGTVLDREATRSKMNENGFVIYFDDTKPEEVRVKLSELGKTKYKDKKDEEIVSIMSTCFVEH